MRKIRISHKTYANKAHALSLPGKLAPIMFNNNNGSCCNRGSYFGSFFL